MAITGGNIAFTGYQQPDYSGVVQAAGLPMQAIGQGIEDFEKASQERKKLDAETKATRSGIESAIKLGDALGFDVKGMLSPVLAQMDDPNTTPMQAAALGREAANQISNVLNFGLKAQDQESEKARLSQDAEYKNAQLRIAQQNANSRAQAAIASGNTPPSTLDVPLGDGSSQKMQWDRISGSYVPIQVSGLTETSQIATGTRLVDLVKGFEGFHPRAYSDFKQTSVGYGTRGKEGEVLTEAEAAERLNKELSSHAKRIEAASELKGISLNQNQFNALTSFDFNTGRGVSLIERFGDKPEELVAKMKEYTKAGGKDLPGLVKRRQVEAALFMTPEDQGQPQGENEETAITSIRPGFTPAKGAEKQGVIMTPAQLQEQIASGMKVNAVPADGGNYLVTGVTAGGGPLVNVNTGSGPQQQRETAIDKSLIETKAEAAQAADQLFKVEEVSKLLDEGVKTGFAQDVLMKAGRIFGKDVSNQEAFKAASGNIAMGFVNLTKGSISDREMQYFTEVLAPNIGTSVEGNKKITDFLRRASQKAAKVEQIISSGMRAGKSAFDIDDEVQKFRNTTTLVPKEDVPQSLFSPEIDKLIEQYTPKK